METSKKKKQIRHQTIRRSERLKASCSKKIDLSKPKSYLSRSNSKIQYNDRLMPILSPSRKLQISHHITSPPWSDDNDYGRRLSHATGVKSLPLVLSYATPISSPSMHYRPLRDLNNLDASSLLKLNPKKTQFIRNFSPCRVLDAPGLSYDRKISMIDCSKIGVVAVALDNVVHLWREKNDQTKLLFQANVSDCISCLKFSASGKKLAVGTHSGMISIFYFDSCGFKELKSFISHKLSLEDLILEFDVDDSIWAGSSDGSLSVLSIGKDDYRKVLSETLSFLSTPHSSQIVRISSCPEYVAVGEARGLVSLWRRKNLIRLISHPFPVVDLSWNFSFPYILGIAGGKTVNFYSVLQGKVNGQISTQNDICRVLWSTNSSEIVISTDSPTEHLNLCSYPELQIQNCWIGHECTPIFLGLGGNGSTLISAASDEFIKFWKIFPIKKKQEPQFQHFR